MNVEGQDTIVSSVSTLRAIMRATAMLGIIREARCTLLRLCTHSNLGPK
jgi:hypothetical protein